MTPVKTKQMTFILGRLSGLPTIHAFRRQTTREKRVFVFFRLPLQLVGRPERRPKIKVICLVLTGVM